LGGGVGLSLSFFKKEAVVVDDDGDAMVVCDEGEGERRAKQW